MLINLLAFSSGSAEGATPEGGSSWWMWIILVVLVVGMGLMMFIPQRKQKKRQEEMMSRLGVGSIVTTIGGIVGEVVQLDDKHIWLLTGTDSNKCTMKFVRQAIHAIEPAAGSPEAIAAQKAAEKDSDEVDEIK